MGQDYGGRIVITTSDGKKFSIRGTFNVNPSSYSIEAVTNQDGSVDRTATNMPYRFEFNFADRNIDLDAMMKSKRINITMVEDFSGVTHYYTNGFFVGDPQVNRQTGEVTGVTGAAESYNRATS